jgi:hypothetical protein
LKSLKSNPAYICRKLTSGRWAITRFLEGRKNTPNEGLLIFITVLLEGSDMAALNFDPTPFFKVSKLWKWNGNLDIDEIEVKATSNEKLPNAQIKPKILSLLSAFELYSPSNVILVDEVDYNSEVLKWVHRLLPLNQKDDFSYTIRSLTDGAPTKVISMSNIASRGRAKKPIFYHHTDVRPKNANYANMVNDYWEQHGAIPYDFINACRDFTKLQSKRPSQKQFSKKATALPYKKRSFGNFKLYITMAIILLMIISASIWGILKVHNYHKLSELNKRATVFLKKTHPNNNDILERTNNNTSSWVAESEKIEQKINEAENLISEYTDIKISDTKKIDDLRSRKSYFNGLLEKHGEMDRLFSEAETIKSSWNKTQYPLPKIVKKTIDILKRFDNKKPSDAAEIHKYQKLKDYEKELKNNFYKSYEYLKDFRKEVRNISEIEEPNCYSKRMLEDNKNKLSQLKNLKERDLLSNAQESPLTKHKKYANKIQKDLNENINKVQSNIDRLGKYKSKSDKYFEEIKTLVKNTNEPNVSDFCNVYNKFQKLNKIYPDHKEAEGLFKNEEFTNFTSKILEQPIADVNELRNSISKLDGLVKSENTELNDKRDGLLDKFSEMERKYKEFKNLISEIDDLSLDEIIDRMKEIESRTLLTINEINNLLDMNGLEPFLIRLTNRGRDKIKTSKRTDDSKGFNRIKRADFETDQFKKIQKEWENLIGDDK